MEAFHRKKSHDEAIEQCHWCQVEQRKCQRKEYRFDDRTEAAIQLVLVNHQRKGRGRDRLNLYQCKWCDLWHFSTPPKRGRAKRKLREVRKDMIIKELERRGV